MDDTLLSPEDTRSLEVSIELMYELGAKAQGQFEVPQIAFELGRNVGYFEAMLKISNNWRKALGDVL